VREVIFSKENSKRWKETEKILKSASKANPDLIASLFIQLTDDLAYSQTYFPSSKTTQYLNQLTLLAHQKLYLNKKETLGRIYRFFKYDYPFLIYKHFKKLLFSFSIFAIAVLIGAYSAHHDEDFIRLILSDNYVNETLENIENGNPLGIYDDMSPFPMFVWITLNNIKVSLLAFAFGIVFSVGTGYLLFQNGIMLGAFQYFFQTQNLLWESASGIWMHGTIEIFSIVVAGAGGIVMGNSILFPGNYPRSYSFRKGAMEGIKIVSGLIPLFILAGFIESFLTRHSSISVLSIFTIGLSIILIVFYFFIYPVYLNRKL
jgi:uncharacterized membrane protein SpoIIM required for sporulation